MGKSRRSYPPEFRRQLVELARAGRSAEDLAREFGPSRESIRLWNCERRRGKSAIARR